MVIFCKELYIISLFCRELSGVFKLSLYRGTGCPYFEIDKNRRSIPHRMRVQHKRHRRIIRQERDESRKLRGCQIYPNDADWRESVKDVDCAGIWTMLSAQTVLMKQTWTKLLMTWMALPASTARKLRIVKMTMLKWKTWTTLLALIDDYSNCYQCRPRSQL